MSEFFKALGQAERDRALREQARERKTAKPDTPSVVEAPLATEATVATEAPLAETLTSPAPVAPPAPAAPPAPPASATTPSTFDRKPAPPPRSAPTQLSTATEPSAPPADVQRPVVVEDSIDRIDAHLVSLVTPATFEAEQYRALRHMIEELHLGTGLKVVAVSSPAVGDGKTTTAINLAGALAQSADARVLLIDADLRAPAIGNKLSLQASLGPGLVGAILDRRKTLADVVRRRAPFAMDILPAGDRATSPYELLRSARLGELFQAARGAYDYVIVDTPPIVAVPDCRVLASVVDGFLIVVAAHRTPKRLVEEALTIAEPSKTIGLVYNGDERPLGGYYRHDYAPSVNGNGHRKWRWGRR